MRLKRELFNTDTRKKDSNSLQQINLNIKARRGFTMTSPHFQDSLPKSEGTWCIINLKTE